MYPFPALLALLTACQDQRVTALSGARSSRADPEDPVAAVSAAEEAEAPATVVINELMASNDSVVMDEQLQLEDWVELFNGADEAIDLSGWGLGHDPEDGPAWTLAEGTALDPGGRLVIWLDGEPEQGALHASLNLDADGDTLTLFGPAADGAPALESWAFDEQTSDLALGRFPDGGAHIDSTVYATPGNPNPYDPGLDKDPSNLLFVQDDVLRFELWLPDDSMAALSADPYTWVEGAVGYGGVWLSPVGVRIKGAWGSLRDLDGKVALKVKVDEYIDGARIRGLEKLTFNNMVQDPSCINERLAYQVFRAAGVPAPRTAHTELYLNGEYRGLYAHVESIDDTFLARWFDDPDGNMYEGAYGPDMTQSGYTSMTLDQDGAEDVEPYSELAEVAALLARDPSEDLVDDLEALVNVDEFLDAIAVEVMIAHWDGYFWYPNNYRVYHDPSTGLLNLLPWGVDQTFSYGEGTFSPSGYLAWWCLQVPSLRERYMLALWDTYDRMAQLDLAEDAREAHALIRASLAEDPYKEFSMDTSVAYLDSTISFLGYYPDSVMAEVFPDGVPELE